MHGRGLLTERLCFPVKLLYAPACHTTTLENPVVIPAVIENPNFTVSSPSIRQCTCPLPPRLFTSTDRLRKGFLARIADQGALWPFHAAAVDSIAVKSPGQGRQMEEPFQRMENAGTGLVRTHRHQPVLPLT